MEIDSDPAPAFANGTHNFATWFQALTGATFRSDLVSIEDLRQRHAGRGIIATADIAADTVLFTIPRHAIICSATSALRDKIPRVFDLDGADGDSDDEGEGSSSSQDSWTLLILVLIYEYIRGSDSPWKPYLDILPSAFDTPMFWSPAELSELQASALGGRVGKEEADEMIRTKILSVIRAHGPVFFPSGSPQLTDTQLLELAHRMGSTIMAYAFDLENDDSEENSGDNGDGEDRDEWVEDREGRTMLGMVPMADMLNADAEFNTHINHGDDALTATTLRDIKAGEEILNYYGPLPNGELLRRYGYVTPKHSRYDVVEVSWDLIEARLKERIESGSGSGVITADDWDNVKQRVRLDEDFEESFVFERVNEDPDATGRLSGDSAFHAIPEELSNQFKTLLKAIKKAGGGELVAQALDDKDLRKQLCLQVVVDALQVRERQYLTSLEDDDRLIGTDRATGRQGMAVWVRRGEKQILREAQAWARGELNELAQKILEGSYGEDGPAAKRRRI
ncbi:uncharacterized protein C8A04DRAFT_32992 [Dichotomopilus funicola]|uniref:SET domain-containing protein n=1 Tax=Dichotomopilus funicola TaxID=1934379 RepID=A0AAN6UVY0_9PEZI|nr:hypothetical protein C8A04DRAFT_32992 [Dichotomopilus funicola]